MGQTSNIPCDDFKINGEDVDDWGDDGSDDDDDGDDEACPPDRHSTVQFQAFVAEFDQDEFGKCLKSLVDLHAVGVQPLIYRGKEP